MHKGTLHAVFTWPQRPFLVLCVWKLAFKVATRRHLQPHSPQPVSGSSTLPLPPLHQTGQDLVIYTLDIYRKFPCLSLYFLLSSSYSETSLNLNNIIQAGVSPVFNWHIFQKWVDPVKKKRFGLNQWTSFTVHSVMFPYKTFANSFHHGTTTEVAGKLCSQFIAHCVPSAIWDIHYHKSGKLSCHVGNLWLSGIRLYSAHLYFLNEQISPSFCSHLALWLIMECSTPQLCST